ncbi:MAG: hypothetical protein O3A47_04160 [Chloroflexi bacterium]|nr:hypothetical protein [Chloroflexota bacterium]
MALTDSSVMPWMVKNPGPIVENTWKGDSSSTYAHGQLLKKSVAGTVVPVTAGHATHGIHAIFEDADQTATDTGGFVTIREITEETRFMVQLHHTTGSSAVATQAMIGDQYEIDVADTTDYIWTVDLEATTNADVEITDIWDNSMDFDTSSDASGNFGLVEVKITPNKIDNVPA